jgi:hypothetical protein
MLIPLSSSCTVDVSCVADNAEAHNASVFTKVKRSPDDEDSMPHFHKMQAHESKIT